ncbi:MAG: efflux RND transporter periplasmic adaptor subunit [Bacillota bacterium]
MAPKQKWLIGAGIAVLVLVLGWVNYRKLSGAAGDAVAVRTQVLEPQDLQVTVLAPATLAVAKEYEIRSLIQASSISLAVEVGDRVRAGQVLARADTWELDLAVAQAESNFLSARAQLEELRRKAELGPEQARQQVAAAEVALEQAQAHLAQVEATLATQRQAAQARLAQARSALEQARAGLSRGQVTPEELEAALHQVRSAEAELAALDPEESPQIREARLQVRSAEMRLAEARLAARSAEVLPDQIHAAEAQLAAAEAALRKAREDRGKAEFRSPVDGTVLRVEVKDGQPITPGTLIAVVAPTEKLKALVRVDEMEIGKVQVGQKAILTTPAYPEERFEGVVVRIDPQGVRSETGTSTVYPVEVEVEARGKLRPNMNVDAEIIADTRTGVLALPLEALLSEGEDRWYVWVVRDGKATRVEVRPGLRTRTQVEITEGLQPGDEVVVGPLSALRNLREGQRVRGEAKAE